DRPSCPRRPAARTRPHRLNEDHKPSRDVTEKTSMLSYKSRLSAVIRPYWAQSAVDEITPIQYNEFRKFVQTKYLYNYAKAVLGAFKMIMDDAVVKYKYREESPIVEQKR
ncbi:hypothetical protein ACFW2Y_05820, partial [Streptomyces sp. NPDC058877]|uniref:hypothetical protein n=1 Tax=Streptomyces sp. NPDC058877 TaxID=3346665 RepID=UPI0036B545AA